MAKAKGSAKTGGRQKGVPNKLTAGVKDAIANAFKAVGGATYLETVAREHPAVFCTLLGKILPTELTGANNAPLTIQLLSFADSQKTDSNPA